MDPSGAEDVAAEAFARLWSHWDQIEDRDHAGGYVFKTAMRLCRRRNVVARKQVAQASPDRPSVDDVGRVVERRDVFASLARLPVRQRQCVVLRDWAGFATEEVAAMLGLRSSTVRVHVSRGRRALRRALSFEERDV
jgi:RNA polymerase sigma factor (sigma-70 family)